MERDETHEKYFYKPQVTTLILTEIKGFNAIIMLLEVGVTLTYSRPNYRANSNYVMT